MRSILHFFLVLFILLCMILATIFNKHLNKTQKHSLLTLMTMAVIVIISNAIDSLIGEGTPNSPIFIRIIAEDIGYLFKPLMLYILAIFYFEIKNKKKIYFSIPAIINTFISLCTPWTKWIFTIDSQNYWQEGPLFYVFVCISLFYFILFCILYIKHYKQMLIFDRIAIGISLVVILVCSIIDIILPASVNTTTIAAIFSLFGYYVYIETSRNNEIIQIQKEKIKIQEESLLNSEIQPHFIYNTLNVIESLCLDNPKVAAKCTENFSNLLRKSNYFGHLEDKMIKIEDEIEYCRYYTDIEQVRFNNLRVIYEIQDGDYKLPFLSIEPLIENAIRHGVRNEVGGLVKISLKSDSKYHIIEVSDNGNGVSKATNNLGQHHGIGLTNVKNRLNNISASLDITFKNTGTICRILIKK